MQPNQETVEPTNNRSLLPNKAKPFKPSWLHTLELWVYTAIKSPMIFFVRPRILTFNDETITTLVKLNRRNKNPFKSMYFGSLTTGAEIIPGISIYSISQSLGLKAKFLVKEFHGYYTSQATTDIVFKSHDNPDIKNALIESSIDGKSKELTLTVQAYEQHSTQPCATFNIEITLSVKKQIPNN